MYFKNAETWGKSHIGYKRKNNEDRFLINKLQKLTILAVADGMGGHAGGEIASQIVIDAFIEYKFSEKTLEQDLKTALEKAQNGIFKKVAENSELDGMGSTLTAAVLYKNMVSWIHVGDSRLYLLHNKEIKQITRDQNFIQDLIDDGTITLEQAKTHPLRNVLDQCVGCDEIEPDTGAFNLMKDDRILICSDGLTKHLSDLQIKSILAENTVWEAGRQLISTALEMGGTDNVTVIVKEFVPLND